LYFLNNSNSDLEKCWSKFVLDKFVLDKFVLDKFLLDEIFLKLLFLFGNNTIYNGIANNSIIRINY